MAFPGDDPIKLRLIYDPKNGLREISVEDLHFLHAMLVDPETSHLKRPCRDEISSRALLKFTISELKERYRRSGSFQSEREWIAEYEGKAIGTVNIVRDMKMKLTPGFGVAWIGIGLSSKGDRRKGLGSRVLKLLEKEAREMEFVWAEAGVFSFNEISLRFFEKNGYQKIGERPEVTWWQGRFWPGYYLAKKL